MSQPAAILTSVGSLECSDALFTFMAREQCLCELTDVLTRHRAAGPHCIAKAHLVQTTWNAEFEIAYHREKQTLSHQFSRLSAPTPLSSLPRVELPSTKLGCFCLNGNFVERGLG